MQMHVHKRYKYVHRYIYMHIRDSLAQRNTFVENYNTLMQSITFTQLGKITIWSKERCYPCLESLLTNILQMEENRFCCNLLPYAWKATLVCLLLSKKWHCISLSSLLIEYRKPCNHHYFYTASCTELLQTIPATYSIWLTKNIDVDCSCLHTWGILQCEGVLACVLTLGLCYSKQGCLICKLQP